MRCQSCSEEISSKFASAISRNACPYCGDLILSDDLKNVLAELHTVFEMSKEFPDEVGEWLSANYGLVKVADDQVVVNKEEWELQQKKANFVSGGKGQSVKRSGSDGEDGKMMEDADMGKTVFSQRAGVKIPSKSAIDYIRSGNGVGAARPEDFVGSDEDEEGNIVNTEPLDEEEINNIDDIFNNPAEDRLAKLMELEKRRNVRLPVGMESKVRR